MSGWEDIADVFTVTAPQPDMVRLRVRTEASDATIDLDRAGTAWLARELMTACRFLDVIEESEE